jgi:hypothetical protein
MVFVRLVLVKQMVQVAYLMMMMMMMGFVMMMRLQAVKMRLLVTIMSLQLKMMVVACTYQMVGLIVQNLMHSIHGVTVVAVDMMKCVMIQMLHYGITVVI